jgi:hypothetical protein
MCYFAHILIKIYQVCSSDFTKVICCLQFNSSVHILLGSSFGFHQFLIVWLYYSIEGMQVWSNGLLSYIKHDNRM